MADCVDRWSLIRFDQWWWTGDAAPVVKERWVYVVLAGRKNFTGIPMSSTNRPKKGNSFFWVNSALTPDLYQTFGIPGGNKYPLKRPTRFVLKNGKIDQSQIVFVKNKADETFYPALHPGTTLRVVDRHSCSENAFIHKELQNLNAPVAWYT